MRSGRTDVEKIKGLAVARLLVRRVVGLFSLLLLAGMRLALAAKEPTSEDLSAKQIIDRMAEVYAGCNSYRDSGSVKTQFIGENNFLTEKTFKTAFVRHDRFRFEYREEMFNVRSRNIIWSNGKDVQTWWDVRPGVEKAKSLDMAVAGATGVSSSSAHTVPRLLLPDEVSGTEPSGNRRQQACQGWQTRNGPMLPHRREVRQ